MNILLVGRAEKFSPNSVDRDAAILATVQAELEAAGYTTSVISETDFICQNIENLKTYSYCFHMARSAQALCLLQQMQEAGCKVINRAEALQSVNRRKLLLCAEKHGIGVPKFSLNEPLEYPFWWKRDDQASQASQDVVLVRNKSQWEKVQSYHAQAYVAEEHLSGDLIKFYGVCGTKFFHWNYPVFSKFGKECENGQAVGYTFRTEKLATACNQLAILVGLEVYGGDAIVTADGKTYIIDFNDWPSFSSCLEQAGKAIASLIENRQEYE